MEPPRVRPAATETRTLPRGSDGAGGAGADVDGRTVQATGKEHVLGDKIRVFTYKNKSRQHKRRGHRQPGTTITINEI